MFNINDFTVNGEKAIITGAAAGIGLAIAKTLALAGADVVLSDLNLESAQKAADEINAHNKGRAYACVCDVTKSEDLSALVNFAADKMGGISILISNAGGGGPKPFTIPMSEFIRAFDLNVFSLFHLAQLVTPHMEKEGHGSIVAITSMAAENKNIHMASYASSKAAASHLVRNIAHDLGEKNIRVNGIAPGATLTDALESVITPEIEQKMLARTPIKRLGKPQDMANVALFLCSPAASWVSGQIITVSGGGVQELS